MIVSLTLIRYRKIAIPLALLAMAIHRIPLILRKNCSFWKLMGCGKNGSFDLNPDWQQWGLLAAWETENDFEKFYQHSFIGKWWRFFSQEQWTILCEPLSSHGEWNGKAPFGHPDVDQNYQGPVAVLTRAEIRLSKLKAFWANVGHVSQMMAKAPGYQYSVGIGEAPFYLQATFSVWDDLDKVKAFAYQSAEHASVIRKTRKEDWYKEELFARFKPLKTLGKIQQSNPLEKLNIPHQD
ncbi:MAG: DUF3291 domain-containing protein [Sphingobacteriaceae bacterium]